MTSVWYPVASPRVLTIFFRALWLLKELPPGGNSESMAGEAVGSVFYLSTQSDASMSDVISQGMNPGPSGVV